MIVAMITMGVVEVAIHQVVDVIAVRHHLMAAARAMYMIWRVPRAVMIRRATIGICL